MRVDVITPEKLALGEDCRLATLPTSEGEVGVEEGHAHMMATLAPGEIRLYCTDGPTRVYAISGGVMEVRPARLIVLADAVESLEKIDLERARRARERAEKRLAARAEGVDMDRAQAALARAINRIRGASRREEA